jgi:hypothetical protein
VSGCFGLVNFGSGTGKLDAAVAHEILRQHDLAANHLISLTKSLVESPHHELPHPRLVARPRPGHIRHLHLVVLKESPQVVRRRIISGDDCRDIDSGVSQASS